MAGRIRHDEYRAGCGIAIGLGVAKGWQYGANRQNNGQQDTRSPNHSSSLFDNFAGSEPVERLPKQLPFASGCGLHPYERCQVRKSFKRV
jgi:hypothetical protein